MKRLPAKAARQVRDRPDLAIERVTRRLVGEVLAAEGVIASMIGRIKTVLDAAEAE